MTVEPASGSDLVVEVTRVGADAERLRVATGPSGERSSLRVIFPADRIRVRDENPRSHFQTEVQVRDDGTFGGTFEDLDEYEKRRNENGRLVRLSDHEGDFEARADLAIRMPEGADLVIHLAAGEVRIGNVDGRLAVHGRSAQVVARGTRGQLRVRSGSGGIDAARTRGRLELKSGSGSIRLEDVAGDVRIKTGSGSVTLEAIAGGTLSVRAGSASISAGGIASESVNISAGSGRVRLGASRAGQLNVSSGSGEVDVEVPASVRLANVRTGSGRATLRLPADLDAEVQARSAGGVNADVSFPVVRRQRSSIVLRAGDGQGRVMAHAGSGSIHLRPATD